MQINEFMTALSRAKPPLNVVNQYHELDPLATIRRQNLQLYIDWLLTQRPTILLLGEAVGYRGGRLTGVPFVSEQIMLEHPLFGSARGYVKTPEWPNIVREATATMMWQTLDTFAIYPALWNVFPFHPHQPDKVTSNRQPTVAELELGRQFVCCWLDFLPIETVVAVGNTAEVALRRWGITCLKLRHPSHGGKRSFQMGLTALLDEHV